MEPIALRPHHLDALWRWMRFERGLDGGHRHREFEEALLYCSYGSEFHAAKNDLFRRLVEDPTTRVHITDTWDYLCDICPHNPDCGGEKESEELLYYVTRLGLSVGDTTTSGYIVDQMLRRGYLEDMVRSKEEGWDVLYEDYRQNLQRQQPGFWQWLGEYILDLVDQIRRR